MVTIMFSHACTKKVYNIKLINYTPESQLLGSKTVKLTYNDQ